jgi:hypothetical protein
MRRFSSKRRGKFVKEFLGSYFVENVSTCTCMYILQTSFSRNHVIGFLYLELHSAPSFLEDREQLCLRYRGLSSKSYALFLFRFRRFFFPFSISNIGALPSSPASLTTQRPTRKEFELAEDPLPGRGKHQVEVIRDRSSTEKFLGTSTGGKQN